MKSEDLWRSMTDIDDDYLKDAHDFPKQRRILRFSSITKRSAAAVVLIIALLGTTAYAVNRAGLMDFFFGKEKEEAVSSLLERDGQSYTIDDYVITLEEYLCESTTRFGYMVFSIVKDKGKPEAEITDGYGIAFGEDDRFAFELLSSGGMSCYFTYQGDVLYAYFSYSADGDSEGADQPSEVALIDYKHGTEDEPKKYAFELKPHENSRSFSFADGRFYISPLGIRIESKKRLDRIKIVTIDKAGNTKQIADTENGIGVGGSGEYEIVWGKGEEDKYIYTFPLEKPEDISGIESVELNGEKYRL